MAATGRNRTSGRKEDSQHHDGLTFYEAMELNATASPWPAATANDYFQADTEALEQRRLRIKAAGVNGNGFGMTLGNAMAATAAAWPAVTSVDFARSDATIAKCQAKRFERAGQLTTPLYLGDVMRRVPEDVTYWGTPRASDGEKGSPNQEFSGGGQPLPAQMFAVGKMATWACPQARDHLKPHSAAYFKAKKDEGHGMANLNDQMALSAWPAVTGNTAGNSSRSGDRKDELLLQGMMRENADEAESPGYWATAKSSEAGPDFAKIDRSDTGLSLQTQLAIEGDPARWAAPRAGDWRSGSSQVGSEDIRTGGAMLPEQMSQTEVGGPTTVGLSATTTRPAGSPSPAFPCWLQGYKAEWLFCAPAKLLRTPKVKKASTTAG